MVVVADSHTTIHGAFAVGAGNTDAAFALTTGKLWLKVPESIEVLLKNRLAPGVFSKDIALALIKDLVTDGANYVAVEYHGELKPKLSPALRGTNISNLSAEMGAKASNLPSGTFHT